MGSANGIPHPKGDLLNRSLIASSAPPQLFLLFRRVLVPWSSDLLSQCVVRARVCAPVVFGAWCLCGMQYVCVHVCVCARAPVVFGVFV